MVKLISLMLVLKFFSLSQFFKLVTCSSVSPAKILVLTALLITVFWPVV
ncbi:hypothetical protein [Methanobacterium sp.]